jgi:hypothetical protein
LLSWTAENLYLGSLKALGIKLFSIVKKEKTKNLLPDTQILNWSEHAKKKSYSNTMLTHSWQGDAVYAEMGLH